MDRPENAASSSAIPRAAERGGDEPPDGAPLQRDPLPSYDPEPVMIRRTVSPADAPDAQVGRSTSLMLATLVDATLRTLGILGLTRPSHLPLGALAFGVIFFFLGLPPDWLEAPLSGRLLELGEWNGLVALKAGMYLVLGVFLLHLATARSRVEAASREVPERVRLRLLAGVDALLAEPVTNDAELADWLRRQDAWFQTAVRDLAECVSQAASDALRRAPVDDPVRFRHRYNDVHDAALNLLARRARCVQNLNTLRER
jgi:hypothetical protein